MDRIPAKHRRILNRSIGHQRDRRIRNHPRRNCQAPSPAARAQEPPPRVPEQQLQMAGTPPAHLAQVRNQIPGRLPRLTGNPSVDILRSLFDLFMYFSLYMTRFFPLPWGVTRSSIVVQFRVASGSHSSIALPGDLGGLLSIGLPIVVLVWAALSGLGWSVLPRPRPMAWAGAKLHRWRWRQKPCLLDFSSGMERAEGKLIGDQKKMWVMTSKEPGQPRAE
jgi:hypothetical protein